jgi:AraC-like DNA-binding protein
LNSDSGKTKERIARAVALLQDELAPVPAIREGLLPRWQVKRVTAFIGANLERPIPIDELARLVGLSSSHFCRSFKRTVGLSPHAYLTRLRIEFAQGLMLTTQDPLTQIALRCGMCDQSHFTKKFRRVVGETPHSWRRIRRDLIRQ